MSTSIELALAEKGAERSLRRLSLVIALAAVVLLLFSGLPALLRSSDWAPVWTAGCVVVLALFAVLLAGSLHAPLRLLAVCWYALAPLCIVLELTSFAAYQGGDVAHLRIWVWALDPAALAALTLIAPIPLAVAAAVVASLAPVVSSLLVIGAVSPSLAEVTAVHLAVVTLVLILLALRDRLGELQRSEAVAQAATLRQAEREAAIERQRALTRIVHDEVLAVFTAAVQLGGAMPPELRREAASALATLERVGSSSAGTVVTAADAVERLVHAARDADSGCVVEVDADDTRVPADAVEALAAATAEAVRNSVRHARPGATRRVGVRIADGAVGVAVTDDGGGFDPSAVDPARLGLRESIVGRMTALPGGAAEIDTAPGRGTEVRLAWHA
ncbi:sensor histidine kinase [Microbacterium sp. RD1]|uniref:sensor histidine kinase n=1 Tax=Microbacterium sp. RD1 TaxID=3457313 RepID=UPI003FA56BDB